MKIKEIYIKGFGGLKDYTLKLEDGFNVIFGENEEGKTTVMTFIKSVFYGTGNKSKNIRAKYTPMDGGQMAGRITFCQNGTDYIIERQFLRSDATDKITLINLDSGESHSETNEIGKRIFGMGVEAFAKSMFISAERNYKSDDIAQGELNARLSSVALTGDEDTSFERIEKGIISAKEKVLSKTERAGALSVCRREYTELEERLNKANEDVKRKIELNEAAKKTLKEMETVAKKQAAVKGLLERKEDIKNTEKLKKYLKYKEELDELNKTLTLPDGTVVDSAFVSKIKFCKAKFDPQKELVETLKQELDNLKNAEEMAQNMSADEAQESMEKITAEIEDLQNKKNVLEEEICNESQKLSDKSEALNIAKDKKKPFNPVFLIIGILAVLAGAVCGFAIKNYLFALAVVGVVFLILSFVIKPKNEGECLKIQSEIGDIKTNIATKKDEQAEVIRQIAVKTGEMATFSAIITADNSVKEKRKQDIAAKTEQLETATEKLSNCQKEFGEALGGLNLDEETLSKIEENAEKQKDIKYNLNYIAKDLGGISYEEAAKKLELCDNNEELSNIDFDKVEAEAENLNIRAMELREQKSALETELLTSFKTSEQPEIIEREMKALKETIIGMENFVSDCETCLSVLGESFMSVRKGYGSELNGETLKIFEKLTNGKYKTVAVDKSLEMLVEKTDGFGLFATDYLSTGTEDQAFLALRLAVCSLISDKEKYPVFLDDALSNYDDKRTKTALEFLKDFAKSGQILLFTCHGSVLETARDLSVECKTLK